MSTLTDLMYDGLQLAKRALDLLTKRPPLTVILLQEGDEVKEFRAIVPLPTVDPADHVTVRKMTFIVDGVAQPSVDLPPDQAQFEQWCQENTTVKFSLRDGDDATPTNFSAAGESRDIVVTDTIPPRQPGGADGLTVTFDQERQTP